MLDPGLLPRSGGCRGDVSGRQSAASGQGTLVLPHKISVHPYGGLPGVKWARKAPAALFQSAAA